MQKLEERYEIARLIAAELTGLLSETEQERLQDWRNASERNEQEYLEIRKRLYQDLQHNERLDITKEWEKFERKVSRKKQVLKLWYTLAACIVICLSIPFLSVKPSQPYKPIAHVSNKTKGFKATLILGNGEQIYVGDSLDKTITTSKGAKIVTAGNSVKYNSASTPQAEEWNTMVVPRGAEYELVLADGTKVWLNSESSLTYPVHFTGDKREVKMSGEVCFDVTHRENQPFIVKTTDLEVRVLGTLFNIEAYPEEHRITTTLVRGKVEVLAGKKRQMLQPNEQLSVIDNQFSLRQVVAEDYIGWTGGLFHFTEASLEEIMLKLARWYDVEFFFANPALKEAHFSLDIRRYEDITTILSKLEKTGRARFRVNDKTVIVDQ